MSKNFSIIKESQTTLPSVVFADMKEAILGKDYELSLIITTPDKIRKLNKIYRDIDKPTDILSFPLNEKSGEIYLCLEETKKEAVKFDRSYENFIPFLFIHGCVHLKGYDHSSKMESIEKKFRKQFSV